MTGKLPALYMKQAVDQMRMSEGKGPKVGAVIVTKGHQVIAGHKKNGTHAERAAIEEAQEKKIDLRGATLYSTLEPCVSVGSKKEACSDLISRVGIKTVYIGRYDPNPNIQRLGWKKLRDEGISLHDFDIEFRNEIDEINQTFMEHFVSGTGPTGGARFDYQLNGGEFEIQFSEDDERSIITQWTNRGKDSIYAYAVKPVEVAIARYATEFSEIDDPLAYDFTYTVPVSVGEIAIFVSNDGAVLVKVLEVESDPAKTTSQKYVKIKYEVRPKSA
ncbi:deaminase [Shewanella loihica]|uniref:CMP/dCMP deaminase, zinc-binding n=1 Tax=Shewanella loihica (strain ATCC BAA-1088 / PV-4) TaxID=323850 RepID=A3QCH8_SHELP|nr:deaminase [Shewanella loihica]ABO23176.1 CMP/dCMP deaminase, zinc-binding [Shewanella loihica PV-4]